VEREQIGFWRRQVGHWTHLKESGSCFPVVERVPYTRLDLLLDSVVIGGIAIAGVVLTVVLLT